MRKATLGLFALAAFGCNIEKEGAEPYPSHIVDSVDTGLEAFALESGGGAIVLLGQDSSLTWRLQAWTPGELSLAREVELGGGAGVGLLVEGNAAYVGLRRSDSAGSILSVDISTGEVSELSFSLSGRWRSFAKVGDEFVLLCDSASSLFFVDGEGQLREVPLDYTFLCPSDALWDGERLLVAELSKCEVLALTPECEIAESWKVGENPSKLAFDGEHRVFVVTKGGLEVLSYKMGHLGTIPLQGAADVALGPDAAFVADGVGIASIDLELLKLLGHAPAGKALKLVAADSEGRAYGVAGSKLYMAER